jgi:hypothetical protein
VVEVTGGRSAESPEVVTAPIAERARQSDGNEARPEDGLSVDYPDRADREAVKTAFRAHLSPAFERVTRRAAGLVANGEPATSLANCEKVPTSTDADGPSGDYAETASDLDYITDATEAVRATISRSRERQEKVLGLIQAGEVAHAKRLAMCGRKSVQLECGGCGSGDNYIPVTCDSRLCPDCMNKKMGRVANQYLPVVQNWDHATMIRLSLPQRVEASRVSTAVDALRGAFGRLRRRKVQVDGPMFKKWMGVLRARGERKLAKRWEMERNNGRGIPMDEIIRSGFYGVDIKQDENGTLNVHMHILADVPYLPQSALSEIWGDLTDAPVVDIRRVDESGGQGRESALLETVGYAAKAPEYESVDDEVAYYGALKGTKLVQPFGQLHGNTPDGGLPMFCCTCEQSPDDWLYLGVVEDGGTCTVGVGSPPDGDRPPPA